MSAEIAALKANPQPAPEVGSASAILKQARELATEFGIGGATPEPPNPWASVLDTIAKAVPMVVGYMAQRDQQAEMLRRSQAPTATVTQVPSQQAAPTQPALAPEVVNLLTEIKTPFMNYIRRGASGEDYADLFLDSYGEPTFASVKQFGPEQLMAALQQFPPIWGQLQSESIGPDRIQAFVNQFCGYTPKELTA